MRVTAQTRAAVAEAAWAVALRLRSFGYAEISVELGISLDRATEIVRAWVEEGACEVTQKGIGLRNQFRPVAGFERAKDPERQGSVPLNLWTAMRGLKSFTPTDLAAHSTTGTVHVTAAAAQAYCQALLRAGYLKVMRTAIPGRRPAIYRLIRNTGPNPPRERRVRAVYDGNLREIVHVCGGDK